MDNDLEKLRTEIGKPDVVLAIGVDIVDIPRVAKSMARFPDTFPARILTAKERAERIDWPTACVACRFAAKEAAVKALGTGFSQGIGFHQIEVIEGLHAEAPRLVLHGPAHEALLNLKATRACLTMSCHGSLALAMVLLF